MGRHLKIRQIFCSSKFHSEFSIQRWLLLKPIIMTSQSQHPLHVHQSVFCKSKSPFPLLLVHYRYQFREFPAGLSFIIVLNHLVVQNVPEEAPPRQLLSPWCDLVTFWAAPYPLANKLLQASLKIVSFLVCEANTVPNSLSSSGEWNEGI